MKRQIRAVGTITLAVCLGVLCASGAGAAERPLKKVRLAVAAAGPNPFLAFITVPQGMGYYREEGLDVDILFGGPGTGGSLGLVTAGSAEFGLSNPPSFLQAAARGTDLDAITLCTPTRDIHWTMAVPAGSPPNDLRDLKGKKIGILSRGDSNYFGAQAMLKEVGLDPDKDVDFVTLGAGGPAASAVRRGEVDALAFWDAQLAALENVGLKFKLLPLTPSAKEIMGTGIAARRDYLKENREAAIGICRAVSKGTVFTMESPEAAARMHFKLYPESRPKGKTEEDALRDTVHVIKSRADKFPKDPVKFPKYGYNYPKGWETYIRVLGLDPQKVGDVRRFYTNDLLDAINDFDEAAVRKQAREYR